MSNLKDIEYFNCPYPKIQCMSCEWNYAGICNFDFDSYQRGREDRDKEILENSVFFSNIPIEDIVLNAVNDERERIVAELSKNGMETVSGLDVVEMQRAIDIVRGDTNERS